MFELVKGYVIEYWQGIIAIIALLLSIYQILISKKHNRISVNPKVSTFSDSKVIDKLFIMKVDIMNNGLGPAIIESFDVFYDDHLISSNDHEKLANFLREKFPQAISHTVSSLGVNYPMKAGEERKLVEIAVPNFKALFDLHKSYTAELNRFNLVVKYKSVYGEKFKHDTHDNKPN